MGSSWLGDCAVSALAKTFGTPLYVFDEATLRTRARTYQEALRRHYPATAQAAYASKAYLCLAIAELFEEEGLDLDVVSGGELHVALQAGFPAERIHFHGNNKSPDELAQALEAGIGRIVVDNFYEPKTLAGMVAARAGRPVSIWLRLSPGVQAHTHAAHPDRSGRHQVRVRHQVRRRRARHPGSHADARIVVGRPARGHRLADLRGGGPRGSRRQLIEFAAQMRARHGFVLKE